MSCSMRAQASSEMARARSLSNSASPVPPTQQTDPAPTAWRMTESMVSTVAKRLVLAVMFGPFRHVQVGAVFATEDGALPTFAVEPDDGPGGCGGGVDGLAAFGASGVDGHLHQVQPLDDVTDLLG